MAHLSRIVGRKRTLYALLWAVVIILALRLISTPLKLSRPTPQPTLAPGATKGPMTAAEYLDKMRLTMPPGREFAPQPEPRGPATPSPFAQGTSQCLVDPPSKPLQHTGKRALVVYSLTHRDKGVVHTLEMDNFAFFAQHALFPVGFKTALFTQIDYAIVRVAASDGVIHDCTHGFDGANIRTMILPAGPCDICSTAKVLQRLGIDHNSKEYAYVVSINSGTRGPFFTTPTKTHEGDLPYTWIDHMALGGGAQFSEKVISAAAGSAHILAHFQTYAFGLSTYALRAMGPFFAATCKQANKEWCIYTGELLTARAAFNASLRVRSMLHSVEHSFPDERSYERFILVSGIPSPLISHVIHPCRMLFAKFGGDTFDNQRFPKSYVDALLAQTLAQSAVRREGTRADDAVRIFTRAYFGC